jgi:hypothetical protein
MVHWWYLHGLAAPEIALRTGLDLSTVSGMCDEGFADISDADPQSFQGNGEFIDQSSRIRPRLRSTTEAFEGLVSRIYVPTLKRAGYKKTRSVWHREGRPVWPVVDIQRGNADGDLLTFTTNWAIHVPGYSPRVFQEKRDSINSHAVPLGGRIGEFTESREDHWWAAGLGQLRRTSPNTPCNSVEAEISDLLSDHVLPFLDRFTTIRSVIDYIEVLGDSPEDRRPGGTSRFFLPLDRTSEVLRSLE